MQDPFPLAPNSQFDPNSGGGDDRGGSFAILSQSTLNSLINYYTTELPNQGWTFRYVDANNLGGVDQYWNKNNIYLSLTFGYIDGQLTNRGQYECLDPQAVQALPKDFPLLAQAELVSASDTSWEIDVSQDYLVVTAFYNQQLASLNWTSEAGPGAMEGSCGGDDCGGSGPTFPAGITPMPSPTFDSRQGNTLVYTIPNGDEIQLKIIPHQNGTIIYIDLTMKNLESAGLPQDVPIYPGAVVQLINPGMATFQITADVATIKGFYQDQMPAAGWIPDGNPIESSGSYMQNWKKNSQSVSIEVVPMDQKTSMLVISCDSCTQ
jgi:hypothetical protein